MKKIIFKVLQYLIPLAVAIGLLLYAFQGVKFSEVIDSFKKADYRFILLSTIIALLSHFIRAYRWHFLLKPLGYNPKLYHSFIAVMVGYFMNLVIPRAGEVARSGTIKRTSNVSMSSAFGTIVLERIIDVFMLLAIIIFIFLVEFNRFSGYFVDFFQSKFSGEQSTKLLWLGLIGLGFLLIFGVIIYRFRKLIRASSLYAKFRDFLQKMLAGILSIRKVRNKGAFFLHTILIWVCYYLMMYALFFCFPETSNLGAWAGFVVFVAGGIGMAAPVQGGIGAYHLLVSQVLLLYAVTEEQGIILATFMHTVQTLIILVFGGIALAFSSFMIVKNSETSQSDKEI